MNFSVWRRDGEQPSFYHYQPSLPTAVGCLLVYAILFGLSLGQTIWYRAPLWWPMILAVLMEVAGYAARVASIADQRHRDAFIMQTVLILVAPAVMAAACYMAFGRLVLWVVPVKEQTFRHLWAPVRRLTPTFVAFDVLSFLVQVAGAAMLTSAEDAAGVDSGRRVVLLGLLVQIVCFGFFGVVNIRLLLLLRGRLAKEPLPKETAWCQLLKVIIFASVVILLRSIYRLVEYGLGHDNFLIKHEIYHYLLDALPIVVVVAIFSVWHPAQYLPYIKLRRRKPEFSVNYQRSIFPQR